jgi:hypothetical protein
MRTFGFEREKVTRRWRKLHAEELQNFHSEPHSNCWSDQMKQDKAGGTYVNRYGRRCTGLHSSTGKLEEKKPLEKPMRRREDNINIKLKLSHYTPRRRLGGEEV